MSNEPMWRVECPDHDCEFATNPEKGACEFHEAWGERMARRYAHNPLPRFALRAARDARGAA